MWRGRGSLPVLLGVLLGLTLALTAACGGAAANGGGKGVGPVPTVLPAGATLGCAETPSSTCEYGGATAAPKGLTVAKVGQKITPTMFRLTAPMAIVKDAGAPGGAYISIPPNSGSTSSANGEADAAVSIPQTGYYILWAATQSGDTTTGTDSFFLGFDGTLPSADLNHTWSIKPDHVWHIHDTTGGCVQIVHTGPNDAPNGCDTWHFRKGILEINLMGRESNSHLAYLQISPANPKQPLPDQRA